jgi:hypothetical protein
LGLGVEEGRVGIEVVGSRIAGEGLVGFEVGSIVADSRDS